LHWTLWFWLIALWLHILNHKIFMMLSLRWNLDNPKGSMHLIFYKLAIGEPTALVTFCYYRPAPATNWTHYAYQFLIFHPVEIVATLVFI
jgi:hypothetical protein